MPPCPLKREFVDLWRLALPLALAHVGTEVMRTVDTALVGRLGAAPLGALGIGNALFFAISILGIGVMMGLDPLVAQAIGAGDRARARQLLWQGIWLSLGVGLVLSAALAAALPLFALAGVAPEVEALARPFLAVRILGLWPLLLFVGLRSYLQARGTTWPLLLAMVGANGVNLAAALLLVFGGHALPAFFGPLTRVPAFGATGAALATSLAIGVQAALVALAVALLGREEKGVVRRAPVARDLAQALRIGAPIGLQLGAEVGVFAGAAFLAGRLGATALAAHQVALTLASFTFTVVIGIGAAGSVRVGRAIGQGDAPGTRRAGLVALSSGVAFMSLAALAFALVPGFLSRVLTDRPEVLVVAVPLVMVAALFQLSDGLQGVAAGVLRGAGDTLFPLVANLVGHYAIGLPVAVLLAFGLGMGVRGLWWGLCAGLTAVALALAVRFWVLSARPIARLEHAPAGPRQLPE